MHEDHIGLGEAAVEVRCAQTLVEQGQRIALQRAGLPEQLGIKPPGREFAQTRVGDVVAARLVRRSQQRGDVVKALQNVIQAIGCDRARRLPCGRRGGLGRRKLRSLIQKRLIRAHLIQHAIEILALRGGAGHIGNARHHFHPIFYAAGFQNQRGGPEFPGDDFQRFLAVFGEYHGLTHASDSCSSYLPSTVTTSTVFDEGISL